MRILCVADHIDPLVYSPSVKSRFSDVDFVVSAGDLPMEYLGFISSSLNKPVYFVFGNHHLKHLSRFRAWGLDSDAHRYATAEHASTINYFGSTYVGGRVRRQSGLTIAGLGGCKRYNHGENQFTERQMFFVMLRLVPALLWNKLVRRRPLDILLTHAAPEGINDRPDPTHQGFRVFLWFLRTFRPRYMLHGHIHLYDLNAERTARYHDTEIINVYDHYVLEFDTPTR